MLYLFTFTLQAEVVEPKHENVNYSLVISGGVSLGAYEAGYNWALIKMMNEIKENPGITQYFPPKFGEINGPGGPKDDKIPAMLSDGEFVMTAKAVDNAGGPKAMYNLMNKLDPESSKGKGIMS